MSRRWEGTRPPTFCLPASVCLDGWRDMLDCSLCRKLPLARYTGTLPSLLAPAAATRRYGAARELLSQAGTHVAALLDARNALGRSALALACRAGHGRLIKLLLRKGACLDAQDAAGLTALHHAVLGGHHAVAQHLLKAGADPTLFNHAGVDGAQLIAAWAAQQQGQQDVVQEERRLPQDGPPG